MITIRVCTTIRATPDDVWAAVERIDEHTTWMRDARSITFGSDRHEGVGAEFDCLTKVGPFSTVDHFVVTGWEPGRRMAIDHRGAVRGNGEFRLERRDDDSTEFCWEERLRFPWWFAGALGERLGAPALRRVWTGNLARLRTQIEASA